MRYTRSDLYFLGRANICYHEGKELYYERFLNWTSFASLMLSSAAFVSITPLLPQAGQGYITGGLAVLVTFLNAGVLALGMLTKYTTHADLKKEWMRFVARLDRTDDEHLPDMEQSLHDLNAREPAGTDTDFAKAEDKTRIALGWGLSS